MASLVLALLALTVALYGTWRVHHGSSAPDAPPAPAYDDTDIREVMGEVVDELLAIRAEYGQWKADINLAVADGIKQVERAENRIKATVRRAREQLQEHGLESPGLEAEYRDLRVVDGGRGGESEVPAVQEGMDGTRHPDPFAGLPGDWTQVRGA